MMKFEFPGVKFFIVYWASYHTRKPIQKMATKTAYSFWWDNPRLSRSRDHRLFITFCLVCHQII